MYIDHRHLLDVERDCGRHLTDVDVVRARADRAAAEARAREWLDGHEPAVVVLVGRNMAAYAHAFEAMNGAPPAGDAEPEPNGRFHLLQRAAALVMLAVGCVFGGMQLHVMFGLGGLGAATLGTGLALATAVMLYTFGKLIVAAHAREPRYALARLERWQRFASLALLGAVALFLADRIAGRASDGGTFLRSAAMAILAIAPPVLTGLMLASADVHGWSGPYVRIHRRLGRVIGRMATLRTRCGYAADAREYVSGHEGPAENFSSTRRNGRHATTHIAITLFLLTAIAPVAAAGATSDSAEAPSKRGELWIDESGSPDPTVLKTRIDEFFAMAPEVARRGVDTWAFYRFYSQTFEASPVHIWELSPFSPPECPPLVYSEAARWFERIRLEEKNAWEKACHARREGAKREYETRRAADLRRPRHRWSIRR